MRSGSAPDGFKTCTACGEKKAATREFWHAAARGKYGLEAQCKPYLLAKRDPQKHGRWYHANKARARELQRRAVTRRRTEQPDQFYAAFAAWRQQNRAEIRRKHREWSDANRPRLRLKKRASQAKRRAQEASSPGSFTAVDVERMLVAQRRRCWWCRKKLCEFHVDHRIPLSRGGTNGVENIVIACPTCNISRRDKMPWEWKALRLL